MRKALLVSAALIALAESAAAERLVVSLSNQNVAVTSNFVGETLVLFGTVEADAGKTLRPSYDLVLTVTGPPQSLRTRRKERVLGIWMNLDTREFVSVPSYLAILSNRPIESIATPERLRRLQVGLSNTILTQHIGPDFADTVPDDPFRTAFVRMKQRQGFYRQADDGVSFLTPTVFRASIPLPANAETGIYNIDAKLFAEGQMIARASTPLEVTKTGFEQYVAEAAQNYGFLYGLTTTAMALMIGWFATVVFRRD
jgi:uncharacterized protein (TIGR02186 family)